MRRWLDIAFIAVIPVSAAFVSFGPARPLHLLPVSDLSIACLLCHTHIEEHRTNRKSTGIQDRTKSKKRLRKGEVREIETETKDTQTDSEIRERDIRSKKERERERSEKEMER